jgi:hypothetical protein
MSENNFNRFVVKVPPGHCLSKVCGQGELGQALLAPGKNAAEAVLAATNGRILAILPVAVSAEGGRPLPRQVPVQLVPGDEFDTDDEQDGSRVVSRGKFPVMRKPLPTRRHLAGYTRVMLRLDQLRDLAAAISPNEEIELWIPPARDGRVRAPVVVTGDDYSKVTGVGLIMPLVAADAKEDASRKKRALSRYAELVACLPSDKVDAGPQVLDGDDF